MADTSWLEAQASPVADAPRDADTSWLNGQASPVPDDASNMRTPGGLYHYVDATTGTETYSKNAPPADAKPYRPASPTDVSDGENFVAGVGKSFVDTAHGVYQLGAAMGHAAGLVSDDKMAKIQSGIDAARAQDAPLMATKAGLAGDISGQAAQFALVPEGGLLRTAAAGGAMGAAQPVATGETRVGNATAGGAGGAVGSVAGRVIGAVVRPVVNVLSDAAQAAVNTLRGEGIPLSVAQRTGSKLATHVERASAMTGDAAEDFSAQQGPAFNRAVLRRIGVNDPNVEAATPDVLSDAKGKITDVMDAVAARSKTPLDAKLAADIAQIRSQMPRTLQASKMGPLQTNIDDIAANAKANGGVLDGQFVQRLNSTLSDLASDPELAPLSGRLREVIADATGRGASPEDVAALAQARRQYRALKQIEGAVDPATGNISPLALMRSLGVKANRNQALYGQGDQSLLDLAKAAKQVLPEKLGNSGTAERLGPAVGAIETLGSGEPVKAATKLIAGVAGLNAAGRAVRNQGAVGGYLANGIPVVRAAAPVVRKAGRLAGYGAAEEGQQTKQPASPQDIYGPPQ